jgi:EGF-like domain
MRTLILRLHVCNNLQKIFPDPLVKQQSRWNSDPLERSLSSNPDASWRVECDGRNMWRMKRDPRKIILCLFAGCAPGHFGHNCEFTCDSCSNGGVCNEQMHGCVCPAGWTGTTCSEICPEVSPLQHFVTYFWRVMRRTLSSCICISSYIYANCI